ncbi:efflux RND transporter permease subunit [Bacteriovoracales bacterium]|nr:efflux RND transporter permease subunit [Bacteriovoracales bacterium]
MRNIILSIIKNNILSNMLLILVFALGAYSLKTLNRDMSQDLDFGIMEIVAPNPGASAQDMEVKITNKIEDKIKDIQGITRSIALIYEGYTKVVVWLDLQSKDLDKIKNKIREKVASINDFPSEMPERPEVKEPSFASLAFLKLGITSDDKKLLRDFSLKLKEKIEDVSDIQSIDPIGIPDQEFKILLDINKLRKLNLTTLDVLSRLGQSNIRAYLGRAEAKNVYQNIIFNEKMTTVGKLQNLTIRSNLSGKKVKLKHLAKVSLGYEKESRYALPNGKEGVLFLVKKTGGSDIINLTEKIKDMVKNELKLYPEGKVNVEFIGERGKHIKNRFQIVKTNAAVGITLVIFCLLIFLNFNISFWVGIGVPFTLFGVLAFMSFQGYVLDSLSMAAMILTTGIIVDDAIIISESIHKHFHELKKDRLTATVDGVMEVYKPVLTTLVSTFLAFAPLFYMTGTIGKFVYIVPWAISLALIFSLLECTFILPYHIYLGLDEAKQSREPLIEKILRPFEVVLQKFIVKAIKFRYLMAIIFLGLFYFSLQMASKNLKFVLFPDDNAEGIIINFDFEESVKLERMHELIKFLPKVLDKYRPDDIESYDLQTGLYREQMIENPSPTVSSVRISLAKQVDRKFTARQLKTKIAKEVSEILEKDKRDIDSVRYLMVTNGPPVGFPVNIRVIGRDDKERTDFAKRIETYLRELDGVDGLWNSSTATKKEFILKPDRPLMNRLGISNDALVKTIQVALVGNISQNVTINNKKINFRMELNEKHKTVENIMNLRVRNNRGKEIEIGQFCSFDKKSSIPFMQHYGGKPSTNILATRVDLKKISPLEVQKRIIENFDTSKTGLTLDFAGEAKDTANSVIDLKKSALAGLLLIYLLMALLFQSYLQPFYVILSIPMGIIGVIVAFHIHDQAFSMFAGLGTVGMFGVVVNDSLVVIDAINRAKEKKGNIQEAISIGISERLKAVILTTLTTVAGLLPLGIGIGGIDIFLSPMAISMGYGILFGTPMILVLIPVSYVIGEDLKKLFRVQ